MKKYILCCAVILFFTQPSFAHDMWLQESGEGFDILLGHQGQTEPYAPERVMKVLGYTQNGWPVPLDIKRERDRCRVIPDEAFCALSGILDNQYWLKTTEGWKNQRERKGLEILQEGRSYKYTKHIVRWCGFLARPLKQRIEVVPLKDPTSMKEGDRLPVKIFFEGKPVQGARLSKTSHMTNTHELEEVKGDGPFMVNIGPAGLQLINAKLMTLVKKKQVIWFASSLTFSTTK
ncbi:MAG: DUF4198 domain-containing protein [Thermodesulfobacteriota bacterium]|nr:DUF4198 domain-containing protein [Thermodesulfobacteriota bacterium]